MKMAAAEALWNSESPASMSLFTIGDMENRKDVFSIRIPALLSVLSYNRAAGEVKGINQIEAEYQQQFGPGNYTPYVVLIYWSFRIMVGAGFLMLLIAIWALVRIWRKRIDRSSRILRLLPLALLLPYLANSTGWIMTEMGRQPWIVFGLMRTEKGVSTVVAPGMALASLIGFTLIYGALMVADVYLLAKYARAGTHDIGNDVVPDWESDAGVVAPKPVSTGAR